MQVSDCVACVHLLQLLCYDHGDNDGVLDFPVIRSVTNGKWGVIF